MYFGDVSSESMGRICKIYALNIQNLADKTKKNLMYLYENQWLMRFSGVTKYVQLTVLNIKVNLLNKSGVVDEQGLGK